MMLLQAAYGMDEPAAAMSIARKAAAGSLVIEGTQFGTNEGTVMPAAFLGDAGGDRLAIEGLAGGAKISWKNLLLQPFANPMIIASGRSHRHVGALADVVAAALKLRVRIAGSGPSSPTSPRRSSSTSG